MIRESDTEPALPGEPIEPNCEDLKKDHPMDWFRVYGVMNTQYERKHSAYKKKLQGRKIVANGIRQSIHEQYQVFIDQDIMGAASESASAAFTWLWPDV